jgi:hypothetical protein
MESAEAKAERLIREALLADGFGEDQLARWRKGHLYKLKLARQVRTETMRVIFTLKSYLP